jgi:hypothetical protein
MRLAILLAALYAADILTTAYGLAHGFREGAPFAVFLLAHAGPAGPFAFKVAAFAATVYVITHWLRRPWMRASGWAVALLGALAPVVNNVIRLAA